MADIVPPLTPTEDLILEVLAARYRLGETIWTFDSRLTRQIDSLATKGLVSTMSGIVERTIRASLTDEGLREAVSPNYVPPRETSRLLTRNRILAALHEIDQPDAAALATLLSYRLAERGLA